ncbi:ATP-dependent DNA helicase II subunit 1 [Naganishia albida]|nr:ATP-dependent DNA helicase II subunit 1 [Naganishia albida]
MSQARSQFQPSQFAGRAATDAANEWAEFVEDDDDLDENQFHVVSKDHVLFCIDASASMQEPLPDEMFEDEEFNKFQDKDVAFKLRGKGKSPLHIALEVVHAVERAKALTGPQDSVGVLFYNVDPDTSPPTLANGERSETFRRGTVLYQPLRQVNAEEIKRVRSLLEDANNELAEQPKDEDERTEPDILRGTFKPIDPEEALDMADVFECCNHVFRDAGTKLTGTKRVFLVTNNDRPERAVLNSDRRIDPRAPARTRFLDLNSLGVSVDPYFISKSDEEFDQEYYWNDILVRNQEEDDDDLEDNEIREKTRTSKTSSGFDQLLEIMDVPAIKGATKRVAFSLPLKIGGKDGDITIGVHGYSLISAATKPTYKLYDLSGRVAREVQTKTEFNAAATGVKLDPSEIGFAYNFGNSDVATDILDNYWSTGQPKHGHGNGNGYDDEDDSQDVKFGKGLADTTEEDDKGKVKATQPVRTRVTFTNAEIKQFKTLGLDPQIKIIGFQDKNILRFDQNVKHSVFLYPDESQYVGSTRAFAALLAACARKDRHALALVITRRTSFPIFACLIPQEETFNADGSQDNPPGFHMIPLPFADDMRAKPEKVPGNMETCTEEQKKSMETLIKKLKMATPNYVASTYPNPALAFFYAKLQSIAFEEPTFDATAVDDKSLPLYDGIHKRVGPWMQSFKSIIDNDQRIHDAPASAARGTKRAAPASDFDSSLAEDFFATGKANKLTIPQLKEYAKHKGVPLQQGLRKAEILEVLERHRRGQN